MTPLARANGLFEWQGGLHRAQQKKLRRIGILKPDTDGSLMGAVNLAVITLRSAFNAIDVGAMTRIRSGEGYVLEAFNRSLASSLPEGHVQALQQMKAELTALLDETRLMA